MPKPRKCKVCESEYEQFSSTQRTCSLLCSIEDVRREAERKRKRSEAVIRKDLRERKQKLKTRSQWIRDAQDNAYAPYIRYRDKDEPCISCGRYDWEITENFQGGKWDCGHFLTVGARPELRFHPLNAHKQCKSCNGGSGKFTMKNHTVSQQYEVNLVKKIGLEKVLWLEGKHEAQHWTIEDIMEIKAYYKEQLKHLKAEE